MTRYRLAIHAPAFLVLWLLLTWVNSAIDPLWSSYLALVAMYVTAMLGMVILVGLSGQVSLGNGALMAVGGYAFAVSSLHWRTVPVLGLPWNAVWSVVFAGLMGIVVGLVVGGLGARLRGPYLAGLTLGLAVGIPAIAARFTDLLGGNQGLLLTVPYPEGGYATETAAQAAAAATDAQAALDAALAAPSAAPSIDVASAAASSDMLTAGDVTGGASAVPSMVPTLVPSAMPSSDMLTAGDVTGGASALASSAVPQGVASAAPSLAPTVEPSAVADAAQGAHGFVLEQYQASIAIAVACIAGFIALNLVRGRQGRVWRAVRDDPIAASVSGISAGGAKVSAFVVSSFLAALAGAVYAQILSYVGPTAFGVSLSLSLLVGVVLGGRGSLLGAVVGAVLLVGLTPLIGRLAEGRDWPDQVASNAPSLVFGLLVVAVVVVAPAGVAGLWQRRRRQNR